MKRWEKHGDIWRLRVGEWTRALLWYEIQYWALVDLGNRQWMRLDGPNRQTMMRECERLVKEVHGDTGRLGRD